MRRITIHCGHHSSLSLLPTGQFYLLPTARAVAGEWIGYCKVSEHGPHVHVQNETCFTGNPVQGRNLQPVLQGVVVCLSQLLSYDEWLLCIALEL